MRTIDLGSFLDGVERRKAARGLDESPRAVEARRNKGGLRSASKREALTLAETRAAPMVRSYY